MSKLTIPDKRNYSRWARKQGEKAIAHILEGNSEMAARYAARAAHYARVRLGDSSPYEERLPMWWGR